jgi:archaeal cell division control protein 6
MGIVEDELAGPSVFKDRSVLDFDWVPSELPHRQEELRQLTATFKTILDGAGAQNVLVTGSVGTGKTVLSRKFSSEFKEACHKAGKRLAVEYVNCRSNAADALVLTKILTSFDERYPAKGFSTNEMLRDLRNTLTRRQSDLLLILDEADALLAKVGSDLVYQFTRFGQGDPKAPRVHLILISTREDLLLQMDEAARSTFKRSNVLRIEKYDQPQLVDILGHRVRLGFHKGTVDDEVVELIADIASEEGDARYAIEILEHAGRIADGERGQAIEGEHVRAAKANTRSFVTESKLRLLPVHQLYLLVALGRRLKRTRKAFATTGEVEDVYAVVCEEHGETARGHTQFWKYLKELETADWLRLKKSEGGQAGRTQLISLPDVPADVLLKKLDAVLGD